MNDTTAAGKTAIQIYSYESSNVTFAPKGGNVMVNATEMAKPFGKQPIKWLETNQSKLYIDELSKLRNCTLVDLVQVKKGGTTSGTWMHEDVALEFARWLSPKFAIWCNDRIKELLTLGVATVGDDDETIARAMEALHSRRIVYKQSGQWLPTARYGLGIHFATRTSRFVRRDGTIGTSLYTVVTEAGRAMLHGIFDGTDKNTVKKGGAR